MLVSVQITCNECDEKYNEEIKLEFEKSCERGMGSECHYVGIHDGSCPNPECSIEHNVTLSVWEYPTGAYNSHNFEQEYNCSATIEQNLSSLFHSPEPEEYEEY